MENKRTLSGKVALVTGASRGIGRAVSLALAAEGADIALNYHSRSSDAEQTLSQIKKCGCSCMTIQADVSVSAEVTAMVRSIEQELGPIAVLVNNAGIARHQPLEKITEQDWDQTIDTNLKSVFLVTQEVLPPMRSRGWGRIINLSSTAAQVGGIVGPHYTASKAGILGLTHAYASLLTKEGITVNAIAPALIETEMLSGNLLARPDRIPVGRFGRPEEISEVVLMLVRNGYMTGQTINVNGGLYMS